MNPNVPVTEQSVVISNAVQGKAGIYFSCPLRFSTNSYTYMNHFTKNMRDFPIHVAVRESIKTTNMRLGVEKPPFTINQHIYKRYCEKNAEEQRRLEKNKKDSIIDCYAY
jgi:hypothetical protein